MKSVTKKNKTISCSVGILTYNSGETLKKCLESVKDFSEVIVCDGGSSDNTLDIAYEYGCVVIEQDTKYKYKNNKIANFSGVRNQTLKKAKYDWFMFIDSDEFLSKALADELSEIISSSEKEREGVYKMPRKFVLDGAVVDCSSSYPNYQIRFFNKRYVDFFIKKVHERIQIKKKVEVGTLKNHVMVPVDSDPDTLKQKHAYYLSIEYKRSTNQPYAVLFIAVKFNIRALLVRIFKYTVILTTCRGRKMPFEREFCNMQYSLRLLFILIKLILKKPFYDLKKLFS